MSLQLDYSICGYISVAFSASVVLTGLAFPKLMLSSSRVFSHIIFFISLSDMIASIGVSLGIPSDGSPLCSTQAFLYMWFFPASWMWTAMLIFQLRCVLKYQKLWMSVRRMHIICWVTSFACATLPLTTNSYGQDDEVNNYLPCNFDGSKTAAYVWGLLTFVFVLLGNVVLMLYFRFDIKSDLVMTDKQRAICTSTRLYPYGMLICWLPYTVTGLIPPSYDVHFHSKYYKIFLLMSTMYGPVLAVIFFTQSKHGRAVWKNWLCSIRSKCFPDSGASAGVDGDDSSSLRGSLSASEFSINFDANEEFWEFYNDCNNEDATTSSQRSVSSNNIEFRDSSSFINTSPPLQQNLLN